MEITDLTVRADEISRWFRQGAVWKSRGFQRKHKIQTIWLKTHNTTKVGFWCWKVSLADAKSFIIWIKYSHLKFHSSKANVWISYMRPVCTFWPITIYNILSGILEKYLNFNQFKLKPSESNYHKLYIVRFTVRPIPKNIKSISLYLH